MQASAISVNRGILFCPNTLIPLTATDLGNRIGHVQAHVPPLLETRVNDDAAALAYGLVAGETPRSLLLIAHQT